MQSKKSACANVVPNPNTLNPGVTTIFWCSKMNTIVPQVNSARQFTNLKFRAPIVLNGQRVADLYGLCG
jgi:hypothetical protein